MKSLPSDYLERVYAGVLGKIIGVYLGRPVEQWSHERIVERFGEIRYYVNHELKMPLILTDDDITGTFTFVRALADHGHDPALTPAQIGDTWLNYIIENKTILWWGGFGNSTEHTAYLRLKDGVRAPATGSAALNTRAVAEEIGAQIFIDGWALVAPGDPERAADFARRAASVSHDGEAIYGAQVVAAMESLAFVERDLDKLLDAALALIPRDSEIFRMAAGLRELHSREPEWRRALDWIRREWGYDRYGTNCPMVSNHAVVLLGLLYGGDDFQRAMLVTNTAGYDTDCNAANVGCLLGIKNGLALFSAPGQPDWRGPVADRLFLPSADGGRGVSDAVRETYHLVNTGRALAGLAPLAPKGGAQFHFSLPGSVQGWQPAADCGPLEVANAGGGLRLRATTAAPARAEAPVFTPPDALYMPGYTLFASPQLYPGQRLRAHVAAPTENSAPVGVALTLRRYSGKCDTLLLRGPEATLAPGTQSVLEWIVPDCAGQPIATLGLELSPATDAGAVVEVDRVAWDGAPRVTFSDIKEGGFIWWQNADRPAWHLQWVNALDFAYFGYLGDFHIIQNRGLGTLSTGSAEWRDYRVSTTLTPRLMASGGLAARYQGLGRHYALEAVAPGELRLVKRLSGERELWRGPLAGAWETPRAFALTVRHARVIAEVDGQIVADLVDADRPLLHGGIALVVTQGRLATGPVTVAPAAADAAAPSARMG